MFHPQEPCGVCGADTAPGSALFSERRRLDRPDGTHACLCPLCDAGAAQRIGRRLTAEEASRYIETGSLPVTAGITIGS